MTTPRIAPLEPPYEPQIAEELGRWMPAGSPLPPLALFRTLATDQPLAEAMRGLGGFLLSRRLAVSLREREIVIDRVCARLGCEYEWGVHVAAFGAAAGFGDDEIAATLAPVAGAVVTSGAPASDGTKSTVPDASAWPVLHEQLLVRLVDELHDTGHVGDELWRALAAHYDQRQLLHLLVLCGWYFVIAFVANGARVEHEPWARRFGDVVHAAGPKPSAAPNVGA